MWPRCTGVVRRFLKLPRPWVSRRPRCSMRSVTSPTIARRCWGLLRRKSKPMPDLPAPERLFVRLYLDRHVMTQLAVDLRGRGYDVMTTQEAARDTASDEDQLVFATAEGRAILTFNIRDF